MLENDIYEVSDDGFSIFGALEGALLSEDMLDAAKKIIGLTKRIFLGG